MSTLIHLYYFVAYKKMPKIFILTLGVQGNYFQYRGKSYGLRMLSGSYSRIAATVQGLK